jgi:hypothetical protein
VKPEKCRTCRLAIAACICAAEVLYPVAVHPQGGVRGPVTIVYRDHRAAFAWTPERLPDDGRELFVPPYDPFVPSFATGSAVL